MEANQRNNLPAGISKTFDRDKGEDERPSIFSIGFRSTESFPPHCLSSSPILSLYSAGCCCRVAPPADVAVTPFVFTRPPPLCSSVCLSISPVTPFASTRACSSPLVVPDACRLAVPAATMDAASVSLNGGWRSKNMTR
ncbi:hypothetical protein RJT34_16701 [Clitoria ternatea]|uniref:Uncharacterized protein n=1 Tax=Clitoria ternatea TaxID=43366 RepID=A0AAN9PD27_CLITE